MFCIATVIFDGVHERCKCMRVRSSTGELCFFGGVRVVVLPCGCATGLRCHRRRLIESVSFSDGTEVDHCDEYVVVFRNVTMR